MHWLKVHEIPQVGPAAKGKAIVNLLQLEKDERVATTVAVREFSTDEFLVFATAQRHGQEDRRSTPTRTRGPAASSPSTSTRATSCSTCG